MRKKLVIYGDSRVLLGYHSISAHHEFTRLMNALRPLLSPAEQDLFDKNKEGQLELVHILSAIEAAEGLPFKLPLRDDPLPNKLLAAWRHYVTDQGLWTALRTALDELTREFHGR